MGAPPYKVATKSLTIPSPIARSSPPPPLPLPLAPRRSKFWELDSDHDFQLSRADLSRLSHLTPCVLDRVMARAGRPFTAAKDRDRMGYEDFCVFFMASEDKTTAPALRYWFNVCDIDGDGVLTPRDLRWFYDDQARRMRDHGMEVVKFEDILCQLHDLLKPEVEGRLLLRDFVRPERIKLTGALFNALFDLDKFQRFEGREAKMVKQIENYAQSQWDAFAAVERVRRCRCVGSAARGARALGQQPRPRPRSRRICARASARARARSTHSPHAPSAAGTSGSRARRRR